MVRAASSSVTSRLVTADLTARSAADASAPVADLTGRRVLVTGAASGIGLACAEAFAAAHAEVVVLDRDGEGARAAADAVGGRAVVVELGDPGSLAGLELADIDVVVNNAGFQHVAPLPELARRPSAPCCG